MHLVSCKHRTSGLTDLMNLATRLMRKRTELIFQVVREKRMKTDETKATLVEIHSTSEHACLRPAIKDDFATRPRNSGLFDTIPSSGPLLTCASLRSTQPGGKVFSVMSILNMPGSIFLDVSRL